MSIQVNWPASKSTQGETCESLYLSILLLTHARKAWNWGVRLFDISCSCRSSICLRPGHAAFKLPALCLRAALDELALHVPLTSAQDDVTPHHAALEEAVLLSTAVEGELDARFVQLCCPQLNSTLQVCEQLQVNQILGIVSK